MLRNNSCREGSRRKEDGAKTPIQTIIFLYFFSFNICANLWYFLKNIFHKKKSSFRPCSDQPYYTFEIALKIQRPLNHSTIII